MPFHSEAKDMLGHDDDFMAARWTEFHDAYAEALRTFM